MKQYRSLIFLVGICLLATALFSCNGQTPAENTIPLPPAGSSSVVFSATAPASTFKSNPPATTVVAPISSAPTSTRGPQEGLLPPAQTQAPQQQEKKGSMKGIWLSQFDLSEVYLSGDRQRPREDFKSKMKAILQTVKAMGFDTVFVQVHPYGDSFYDSNCFPASRFITGAYGREADYDPFRVIEELCQGLDLSLHAWINPMRLMTEKEMLSLPTDSVLRTWYEKKTGQVAVFGGRCYLDPSYESVRSLVLSCARELCENYQIDGVHMDDYFYPTQNADFDEVSYRDYQKQGGKASLGEFRKENLSLLVKQLYETCHSKGKLFGISPAGNINNVVEKMYADVYRWCGEQGFLDYICPQVYFGFEHQNFPFDRVCEDWIKLCEKTKIPVIVGITFTKAGLPEDPYAGTGKTEWARHGDIVKRSVLFAASKEEVRGVCIFSYSYLAHPLTGKTPAQCEKEVENFLQVFPSLSFYPVNT